MSKSELEQRFDQLLIAHQPHLVHGMQRQYRFHPKRQWKADRLWLGSRVIVELDGGTWAGGRHTRGSGYDQDSEKHMAAMCMGYVVVRFSTSMLAPDKAPEYLTLLEYLIASRQAGAGYLVQQIPSEPPALTYQVISPAPGGKRGSKRQHVSVAARPPARKRPSSNSNK